MRRWVVSKQKGRTASLALMAAGALLLVAIGGTACGGDSEDGPSSGDLNPAADATVPATVPPTATSTATATPSPTATPTPTPTPTPLPPGVVAGTVLFNGESIAAVTRAPGEVRAMETESRALVEVAHEYDPATGRFTIKGLTPGVYKIFAWVDPPPPSPNANPHAGDFSSSLSGWSPEVAITEAEPRVEQDVKVVQYIRLRSPVDSREERTRADAPPEELPLSAVGTFAWDPVPGAARYQVRILQFEAETRTVLGGTSMDVSEPLVSPDPPLQTLPPERYYGFTVEAYSGEGELLGVFRNFFRNGHGGWFFFALVPD